MQKLPMAMHDQCFYETHKYIIVMYILREHTTRYWDFLMKVVGWHLQEPKNVEEEPGYLQSVFVPYLLPVTCIL